MVLVHSKQANNQMLINIIIAPRNLMIASQFYQMIFYITTKYYHERSTILARVQWSEGIKTLNWNMELKFFSYLIYKLARIMLWLTKEN